MGENLEVVGREMSRCSRREPQRVSTSWKEEKKDVEKQEYVLKTRRRECLNSVLRRKKLNGSAKRYEFLASPFDIHP